MCRKEEIELMRTKSEEYNTKEESRRIRRRMMMIIIIIIIITLQHMQGISGTTRQKTLV
jgi:hypothetical protein